MFKEETKELKMSNEFRKKIEMICKFACVKYELVNGNIISIKNTNLAYVKPHVLKVKGNDYLLFEDSNMVFINGYKDKVMLIELEKCSERTKFGIQQQIMKQLLEQYLLKIKNL